MNKISLSRIELKTILSHFDPENIYNFDETALFFRLQPNKTLASTATSGTKVDKNRLTIGVCTNATGTDKCILVMMANLNDPGVLGKHSTTILSSDIFEIEKSG